MEPQPAIPQNRQTLISGYFGKKKKNHRLGAQIWIFELTLSLCDPPFFHWVTSVQFPTSSSPYLSVFPQIASTAGWVLRLPHC